ncbi:MAG: Signal transduction histidine kinase [Gemmatimonadetes bacterium]|nr:Signal transduction histidine kinase [Gemmatimonadota bacterium]
MSLRLRVMLSLLAITAILLVPALYAATKLGELYNIAGTLRTRDAEASLALGRLQSSLKDAHSASRVYVAVFNGLKPEQQRDLQRQLRSGVAGVDRQLRVLDEAGYTALVGQVRRRWDSVRAGIAQQQALVLRGDTASAGQVGRTTVEPGMEGFDPLLDQISHAIETDSRGRVSDAQEAADAGGTGTMIALGIALLASILIGLLLSRSVLRPIYELQRGMATVTKGDLAPRVRIPRDRADELGDLARSFEGMTRQLKELDRLKSEFVSVASHEIKTPLSIIRGYVSLLIEGIYGALSEQQTKTLQSVSDQTDRLTRLVHRLLDVSRFEAGGGRLELREVEVVPFVEELTEGFKVLAMQKGIDFQVHLAADLPGALLADPERLNEVLGNLLSNAFKFTPQGGRIVLSAARQGDGLAVEVQDTGVGIPADKLPKIFQKFFQVENDAQPRSVGSGLGLAIAREIVEAHGGTISAESEERKGTRFRVALPARPPHGMAHYEPESAPAR